MYVCMYVCVCVCVCVCTRACVGGETCKLQKQKWLNKITNFCENILIHVQNTRFKNSSDFETV